MIGLLNQHVQFKENSIKKANTQETPKIFKFGNPLKQEQLTIKIVDKICSNIDIVLDFDNRYFIDTILVNLSSKNYLTDIILYDACKANILYKHSAETNGYLRNQTISLTADTEADKLVVEFVGEFSYVDILEMNVFGANNIQPALFPSPYEASFSGPSFPISKFQTITATKLSENAALLLCEKLNENYGIVLKSSDNGSIIFNDDASILKNGYKLSVNEDKVLVSASDLRGFTYAAETIIKLIQNQKIPACEIKDQPAHPFRGVHLMIPSRENIPYYKRLVKYILSPMGYNLIIMQVSAGMEFDSHPEINKAYVEANKMARKGLIPPFPHNSIADGGTISKKEVADLVAYARKFGIETIPEIQSLGHVQYITYAHPEIAEIPEKELLSKSVARDDDKRPDVFYRHCYCPSNPKSYEILFNLIDEIIEVFQPKEYVHMGHDEVYEIGLCPICKKISPAKLFADDINRIHKHLAQKGIKMMIWADMIQPVTKYETPAAIDMIPKDILMLDFIWYFHLDHNIEDNLLKKGFKVAIGNLYSSHFPRYEERIAKENMFGGQVSAWVTTNHKELTREGKLYDFIYTAEMLWSDRYSSHLRHVYDQIIKQKIPALREKIEDRKYPSLNPDAKKKVLAENAAKYPLSAPPEANEYIINDHFDSLIFHHNTINMIHRIPWVDLETAGFYQIEFENGEIIDIPLEYGGNISHWKRRQNQPFPQAYYRHNGYSATFVVDSEESKTRSGDPISTYVYEWINPKKELLIKKIRVVQNQECKAIVYLHKIVGIQ